MANGTLAASQLEMLTLSGTGVITIVPPNTNTNRTLTLPDATGTVALQGGTGVGKVLQVVQTNWQTYQGIGSSTYADLANSSISITPSSSSSKVLVLISLNGCGKSGSTSLNVKLQRNGSDLTLVAGGSGYTGTTTQNNIGIALNYLDSPASTSAQTYKLQIASDGNVATAWVNNYQSTVGTSSVTLMEIAA